MVLAFLHTDTHHTVCPHHFFDFISLSINSFAHPIHPIHLTFRNTPSWHGSTLRLSLPCLIESRNLMYAPLLPLFICNIKWTLETWQPGHISRLSRYPQTLHYDYIWVHHQMIFVTAFGPSYTLIRRFPGTVYIISFISIHSSICFSSISHSFIGCFTVSLFTFMD